jgi:tRNA-specific 2-thiouridylase
MNLPTEIRDDLRRAIPPGEPVLLALSGGVDSALSLAILRELGHEVLAVTFKNFCYGDREDVGGKACCSLEAIADARELAHRFGARHWVHDVSARFRQQVIDPFVEEYAAARTPNPCLACNGGVRFPALVQLAAQQGCARVATGHYARIARSADGVATLLRGIDEQKDQSYFLAQVPREIWSQVVFPVGGLTKAEVRDLATELGLAVADKPESQEICFVPDGDRRFLFDGERAGRAGPIVLRDGTTVGEHRGLELYTVGQRRGLGVAHPEPLYVLELDAARNRLVVGPKHALAVQRLVCDRAYASVADLPAEGPAPDMGTPVARVRHRHAGVRVAGWRRDADRLTVDLAEPVLGAAPGQGLVLYDGERVLGGGRLIGADAVADVRHGGA